MSSHPELNSEIRVSIVGAYRESFQSMLDRFDVGHVVNFFGFVPHEKAIEYILDADALILLLMSVNTEPNRFILSSKTFEYIGSGRPIIAIATEGDTADFLRRYKIGEIVDPTNVRAISEVLYHYVERLRAGSPVESYTPPADFSRKETAKQLLRLFRETVDNHSNRRATPGRER